MDINTITTPLIFLFIIIMIIAEYMMGRNIGNLSIIAPNSRGIVDIFSLSHIIHGFIFYYILDSVIYAVIIEVVWEILENSPLIINRYRKTVSVDYTGDTIINSINDVMFMLLGFFIATVSPSYVVLFIIMVFELFALWYRRDNLTLNVLMLVYPFENIKQWQKRKLNEK